MSGAAEIAALIARLEAATGPDRELDLCLHELLTGKRFRWAEFGGLIQGNEQIAVQIHPWDGTEHERWVRLDEREICPIPAFTASIDAALTLAEGWSEVQLWSLWNAALCECSKAEAHIVKDLPRFICAEAIRALRARGDA